MSKSSILLKKPQYVLALAVILCVLGSFFAGMFNSSFYSVKPEEITFEADHGTLTGTLYMPKGAGAEDPRPLIITTHGYLNSKEMQDAPAVEMSRRGYIVLALDMYDHGDSKWAEPIEVGSQFSTFWIYAVFDAAKHMYTQDYVKKDDKGNGYIAVSGHSMGGFSTLIAMYMDEMSSLQTGFRMIYAGISVGADYSYAAAIANQDQYQAAFGSRTVGMIGAHFDEFFFNKSNAEKTEAEKSITGTIRYKDFAATNSGKAFLGLPAEEPAGEAGKFYNVESGVVLYEESPVRASQTGKRIIYTPYETHPWNHISIETTSNLIEFYTEAFSGVTAASQTRAGLAPGNQIWWLKEAFNLIAMIGFFMLFMPLIALLLKIPGLSKASVDMPEVVTPPTTTSLKAVYWIGIAVSAIIPAYFYPTFMNKAGEGIGTLMMLFQAVIVLTAVTLITFWAVLIRKSGVELAEGKKMAIKTTIAAVVIAAFAVVLIVLLKNANNIIKLGSRYNEPITNQFAYWAIMTGLIAALITVCFYYIQKKPAGTKFRNYGISVNLISIVMSLVIAIIAVVLGYLLLFLVHALFKTDFRFWTMAVRAFNAEHLKTALRYMPLFLIFYFINAIAVNANARIFKGAKAYITAIILNIGGLFLWLVIQYSSDFITHVGAFPAENLNGIVLIALVPCLAIAAVYARRLFDRTGNVWIAAFLNTMLFTIILASNTVMFNIA